MGINKSFAQFLFYSRKNYAVSFESTITLGRLKLYAGKGNLRKMIEKYGAAKSMQEITFRDGYSEPLFELLGSKQPESLDYSDYEKATHLQDLNQPVKEELKNRYDVVLDSGTLEHVFNFPVAIKSCMEMLKIGGHFLGITPANNYFGHGFYQFSPELYYCIFSKENGFKVCQMLVGVYDEDGEVARWYEVKDQADAGRRVVLINNKPTCLFVIAQKTEATDIFQTIPYQSDYSASWQKSEEVKKGSDKTTIKSLYRKYIPARMQKRMDRLRDWYYKPRKKDDYIGKINPAYFKEIKL